MSIAFERRSEGLRRAVVGDVEYWLSPQVAATAVESIEVTLTSVDDCQHKRLGRWTQTSRVDDETRARELIGAREISQRQQSNRTHLTVTLSV